MCELCDWAGIWVCRDGAINQVGEWCLLCHRMQGEDEAGVDNGVEYGSGGSVDPSPDAVRP